MYVATVGPAEAYLIRQARLSTLPDPHRERGLPSSGLEPDVWRGEISVGDSLVLVSPNVVARLGADELKDAMLTLHPQSAMEHLHARFVAADGSGSDGAIAFEATEVSTTTRARTLVPVRPAEPLAGAPDRSPIPLADNVQAAGAAVTAAAGSAKVAAGGAFERIVARLQDLMPRRKPAYRRVTPLASRRETQRRAAVAALMLVVVVGGLGLAVYAFGGTGQQQAIGSVNAGQAAIDKVKADLAQVSGPGIDLITDDPGKAKELLTEAYTQLDAAVAAKVGKSTTDPLRAKVVTGLDTLFGVVPVASTNLLTFTPAKDAKPFDLSTLVLGPDSAPYVIDRASQTVYRIDLKRKKAVAIVRAGRDASGLKVSEPLFLATGGRDLLILDAKNVLWRWRASDDAGKGTLARVDVQGASQWGDDVTAIGTFDKDPSRGLYNLYVTDPSKQQILAYSPAADGSGFPAKPNEWLAAARPVDQMSSIYVDGDMFVAEAGIVERLTSGRNDDWEAASPGDELLRPKLTASLVAGAGDRHAGAVYGYDEPNARIVSWDKATGRYLGQYRLAGGLDDWKDLRGLYVLPGAADGPATLVWLSKTGLHQAVLEAVDDAPSASPSPSPSPSPTATPKPTKKP